MDDVNQIMTTEDNDNIEDWQYEYSADIAKDFIENKILPQVDQFDFGNSDKNYVKGVAYYALLVELVPNLVKLGYTAEDMLELIIDIAEEECTKTVH